jgi:hypothetical protein
MRLGIGIGERARRARGSGAPDGDVRPPARRLRGLVVLASGRSAIACAGHEVLTPDLPAADDSAGLGEYAKTVVNAIRDRAGVIVVAQSLAALTAPLLCGRVDVRLLVLVAPMIPAPDESPARGGRTAARLQDVTPAP